MATTTDASITRVEDYQEFKIVPDSTCEAETAVASMALGGQGDMLHSYALCLPQDRRRDRHSYARRHQGNLDHIKQEGASSRTRYFERAT